MRRTISRLLLNLIILVCWSIVGVHRAITAPSWLCMIDGAIMMAYICMSIDGTQHLMQFIKSKQRVEEINNEESN